MQKKGIKRTRKIKFLRNAGASVLAMLVVVALVIGLLPSNVLAATADLDTSTKYSESLGDNASTEYAGRIWTDKSVYDENATFATFGGGSVTVELDKDGELDEDFLVAYSALATSEAIEGQTQAPVDVVLIIDISGSMSNQDSNMDNGKSRIYNTVQATNDAIDKIMALNPYTRVAVAAFSSNAQVLLPLDRYTKTTTVEREWVQTGNRPGQGYYEEIEVEVPYFTLSRDTANENYATLYTNAINAGGNTVTKSTSVEGGTNIQLGLYEGMQILAEEDVTTADINGEEVPRVPSVLLLSDGSPTYSSNSRSWWVPEDNYNDGPGSAPYAGNGMKAILVGSYMKDAIDRNYEVTGTAFATTVYTVGMGITGLDDDEKNLAYMTLDPGTHWNSNATNSMKTTIKNYWSSYTANNNTGTLNINVGKYENRRYSDKNYALTHPTTGYDVDPVTGYDYVNDYYDADNASAVTEVFNEIVANISIAAPQVPTELKGDNPITDGYITYTDPIGEYMEVRDVKSIIYAGTQFTRKNVSTSGNTTTYTFDGTVSSPVYGDQDIKNIIITVAKDEAGNETLTIKIPASVIPLRINEVTLNPDGSVKSHTNNGAYPARVVYSVGLKDNVKNVSDSGEEYIDTDELSEEYLAANTNDDGSINFYSNLFTNKNVVNGSSAGDAKVEFEPSHTNPFYYILEDMPIYKDRDFKDQVTADEGIDDDTVYYYRDEYYHGNSIEVDAIERTGKQLKLTSIVTGEDGYLYRAKGSPRLNRMLKFEGTKIKNATGTAEDFYAPTFQHAEGSADPYEGKIVVYLGNNGLLSLPASGNLQISKEVNAGNGLTAPDKTFEFTIDLNGDKVDSGTYEYVIVNQNGEQVSTGTVSKENSKITMKDGQTATIFSLPPGTTYEVTEAAVDGFASESEGATGTIVAGTTSEVKYTNTYNVESFEFPTEGTLSGTKELVGREWTEKDAFTFFITPYNNAPLPTDYNADTGVTVNAPDEEDGQTAKFDFGTIEFTAPGTYRYTVVEKEPENDGYLPGMSYSRALYRVVVEIGDKGDGTLEVVSYDIQKLYTDDATPLFTYGENNEIIMNKDEEAQDDIKFVNTYSAEAVTRVPVALKSYTDNSGMNPLVSGMFEFKLEAVGYIVDNGTLVKDITKVPMPEESVDGVVITSNEGGNVTFPSVTFTQNLIPDDADKITFRYQMSEVIPEDKVNGMTYDETVYTIDVVVSVDENSHILNVEAIYPNDERIVTFKNEYTPVPVTADIDGNKTLVGRDMKDSETFDFSIMGGNAATNKAVQDQIVNIPVDTASVSGGKDGEVKSFAFEDIEFTKAGTYVFAVTETAGDAPSVEYDDSIVNVTVVIDDTDKDGNLEVVSVTYSNGKKAAEFANKYTTKFSGDPISLNGTKNLTGKTLLAGEFFFNVEEYFNGKKVSEGLVSNEADTEADEKGVYTGTISFLKDKTYSEAGTYEYIITEQIPDPKVGGTTYDESKFRFTVVVEDDTNGNLVASTKLEKAVGEGWVSVEGDEGVVFNNKYAPTPQTATVPVMRKVITGNRSETLKAGDFEFELTVASANPADGMILPSTTKVTNDAEGNITFGNITFTKAGTYTVAAKEIIPADEDKFAGMEYSTQELTVTFRVVDDRNGNLTVSAVGSTGGNTFANHYTATPEEVNLEIAKIFTGRDWDKDDKFDFEVVILDPVTQKAIEDGAIEFPMDEGTDAIVTKTIASENETVTGKIKVNTTGTYKFVVREINGNIPGVIYDSLAREVVIEAVDDSFNAEIDVKVSINGEESKAVDGVHKLVFTNEYNAKSTEISGHDNIVIQKNFTGRPDDQWLDSDEFVFVLAAGDDKTQEAIDAKKVELPESKTLTVTNANKVHAHFGNIVFHEAGTYTFTVTEQEGSIPGVTYDATHRTIIVNVIDDVENGVLVASVDEASDELVFNNTYKTEKVVLEGATKLDVIKTLSGRDWFETDEFEFQITPYGQVTEDAINAGDIIMPADTKINIKAGEDKTVQNIAGAFGDITFKKAGSYRFIITEITGTISDVTYDTHARYVTVEVDDNKEGKLVAIVAYTGAKEFVNEYTPDSVPVEIEGTKAFNRTMSGGEFSFEISAITENAPMPAKTTVTNDAEGNIDFGSIMFDTAGEYEYVISEVEGNTPGITYDAEDVKVTVEVTYSSETGEFTTDVYYEKAEKLDDTFSFVNEYNDANVSIVKSQAVNTGTASSDANPVVVNEDDEVTYFLTVTNNGVGTASEVTVTDTIPAGLTLKADSISNNGIETNGIITWEIGELAKDEEVVVSFTVIVPDVEEDTTWDNVALLTYKNPDGDPEEKETNEVTIKETATPDVSIQKLQSVNGGNETIEKEAAEAGDTVKYIIEVVNNGDGVAKEVVVKDAIPEGLTLVEGSIDKDGELGEDGKTITWNLGNLGAGKEETVSFEVTVPEVEETTTWKNVATVAHDGGEDKPSNPVEVEETATAEVSIQKLQSVNGGNETIEKEAAEAGDTVKYIIEVVNNGDGVAKEVVVKDVIPEGLTLVEGSIDKDGELGEDGKTITWNLGNLGAGKEETVSFEVTVPVVEETTTWKNVATVAHDGGKDEPSNPVEVEETATAEVSIQKLQSVNGGNETIEKEAAEAGDTVKYIIEVVNNGDGVAKEVVVKDVIPEGLTLVEGSIDKDGELGEDGKTITWNLGNLGAGKEETVSFEVTVPVVEETTTWKNVATVAHDGGKDEPSNPVEVEEIAESEPVSFDLNATKKVTPSEGNNYKLKAGDFTFHLVAADANPDSDPLKDGAEATNDAKGNVVLADDVVYTEEGTYVYTVYEVAEGKPGIIYDASVYTVTVVVEENDNNELVTKTTIEKDDKAVDAIAFNNGYDPCNAVVIIPGLKVLEGKCLETGEFKFGIRAVTKDAPMPLLTKTTNLMTGYFQFGPMLYDEVGVYEYEIYEINEGKTGYEYDDTVYKVVVTVTDILDDGTLNAHVKVVGALGVVFKNTYDPEDTTADIVGDKTLTGRDLKEGEFTFELLKDGEVVDTATNNADGSFGFDTLTFDKAGIYKYTVVEKDTDAAGVTYDKSVYEVVVTVVDKGGKLVADVTYLKDCKETALVFENEYDADKTDVVIDGDKNLEGRELAEGEFEFMLMKDGEVIATATNNADGTFAFDALTFDEEGTYKYTVVEKNTGAEDITYDETVYEVEIVVTDKGGYLEAEVTVLNDGEEAELVFNNEYTPDEEPDVPPIDPEDPEDPIDPEDPEDPEDPIDPEDPEDPVDPEDPEDPVDPEDPEDPVDPEDPSEDPEDSDQPKKETPDTGDHSNIAMWVTLLVGAFFGIVGTAVYRKKMK